MVLIADTVHAVGVALLIAALVSGVRKRLAARNEQSVDLLLLLCLLLSTTVLRSEAVVVVKTLGTAAYLLVPYALLRVLRQFRQVPNGVVILGLLIGASGVMARQLDMPPKRIAFDVISLTAVVLQIVVATQFLAEARVATAIRRWRLNTAAAGALLVASPFAAQLYDAFVGLHGMWLSELGSGLGFICMYVAFTPPKWLFTRWQQAEQDRYLRDNAKRDPEERGRRAPNDLFAAARRALGGTLTVVVTQSPTDDSLVVTASSDARLRGVTIPRDAFVSRHLDRRASYAGTADCDWGMSPSLQEFGESLVLAPIASEQRTWGFVAVVHRRGALFPDDDLKMLEQLAGITATALDHASLIQAHRARERAEADRRFRELETRVDLMLESIKDYGMFVLDARGHVASWQPGAQHLFGHVSSDITGQPAAGLFRVTQDVLLQWLAEACVRGHAERECECARSDETKFVGVTTIRPLVNEVPGLGGFVAVTHDVTNRRVLEERLRQGQKMEAIGRLAGGIAHDFNNLLAVILGHADWLERELAGKGPTAEVVGIQEAAERAADLTRRLLAFSRRGEIRPSNLNLTVLVTDMLPMLRRLIGDRIRVVDATSPAVPSVTGDHSQLQQVLMNLAVNARDAMPHGGVLTVRTADVWLESGGSPGPSGRHVLLEVSDTGVGMDAETRRLAFEPFFTTKDVGKGTGLGLSTVYGIVQQLGGRIQLESEPGRGTTVRLYLPERASIAESSPPVSLDSLIGPDTLM